ncbi:MAG TPA: hypothetical protein VIQ30_15190 [Pseudonocardia sp.]
MAEWYLAASLVALRTEVNRRWPNRDKSSDGAKGDDAHAQRVSDHNPDWSAGGVVRAVDVDKDGIDVQQLLDAVIRDPRVAYVIWNRRIASATDDGQPWDWEPYDGPNPHTSHVHISIKHTRAAETDTSPWFDQEEDDEMSQTQYDALMKAIGEVKADVRDYALWQVLYGLETEDERAQAQAAFDAARAAGKSIAEAKTAAIKVLQGLVDGVKKSQAAT